MPLFNPSSGGSSKRRYVYTTDFSGVNTASTNRWTVTKSGTAAANYNGGGQGFYYTTGATSGSVIGSYIQDVNSLPDFWARNPSFLVYLNHNYQVAVTNGGGWRISLGSSNTTTNAPTVSDQAIGIYDSFAGDRSNSSPKAFSSDGAVVATSNLTIPNATDNFFEIHVASGNNVTFYKDGILVATITTNLPTGALNALSFMVTNSTSSGNIYFFPWEMSYSYDLSI